MFPAEEVDGTPTRPSQQQYSLEHQTAIDLEVLYLPFKLASPRANMSTSFPQTHVRQAS